MELCSALEVGGLTPSMGLVKAAAASLRDTKTLLHVLVRPRGGGFCYSADEIAVVKRDVKALVACEGVSGVVVGALTASGEVDRETTSALVEVAAGSGKKVTFHRALDLAQDIREAYEVVSSLGCDFVLTSGGHRRIDEDGAVLVLGDLVASAGTARVIAGSGLSPGNAMGVARGVAERAAKVSGKHEVEFMGGFDLHGTLRGASPPSSSSSALASSFGAAGPSASEAKVEAVLAALRSVSSLQ